MSTRTKSRFAFVGQAFAILGAASAAASAIEGHRRPTDRSLRTLGIDPANFPSADRL
ncbi:hypothetical protein HGO38_00230 [Rhizobium sp. CG5]|uniref:hypothetical protein n=1 Tax=Rhizobium sp. CG5 TaxID=2726076 RepID=UPI0020339C38|nr:hypothetical protein [Rhizobium sp. CG5]MCM2471907.1 hypothetical protein [Rhizobium sp. CG5]